MRKIGITGTIASGKTSVSVSLKRRGMPVFNADNYAKMALHKGNVCYEQLVTVLGRDVLDENEDIDAHKMAEIIFNDEQKRKAVNGIVHPFVRKGMEKFFAAHTDKPIVFAEVPLLFESHWEDAFDQVCVITCDKEEAVKRMMRDRSYTKQEAEKRYASQIDPEKQKEMADYVLLNNDDRKELEQKINAWVSQLRKETRHGN
jgi:dephospho-CoA kinase